MSSAERLRQQFVAVGTDLAVPRKMTAEVNGYDVEVTVSVQDGRLVAQEVVVRQREGGPPVTGEALRGIPVAAITKRAAAHALEVQTSGSGDSTLTQMSPLWLTPEVIERLRSNGPTPETLGHVAQVYRLALLVGDAPTRTVETTFGLPRSTAARWVGLARKHGLMREAEGPGKAGG